LYHGEELYWNKSTNDGRLFARTLDIKITDFWDVTQYSFVQTQQHFQETNCLHLHVERLKFYVTLKMQAAGLSEMLVCFYQTVYCPVFVLTAMKTSNLAVFHHSHAAQS
jgi:hypothetical protein